LVIFSGFAQADPLGSRVARMVARLFLFIRRAEPMLEAFDYLGMIL
jgi:hypothetical protein